MSPGDTGSASPDWLDAAIVLALLFCAAFYAISMGALESLTSSEEVVIATGLVATFGIGFLIGRWVAVALALAPAVASILSGEGGLGIYWSLVLFGPTLAAALAAGVFVRRLIERRLARKGRRRARWPLLAAGAVMTAVGALPFAVAGYRRAKPLDRTPARAVTIDERTGSYRGVQIGDRYSRVTRTWGAPPRLPPHRPFMFTRADLLSGELRYPGVAFWLYRARIEGIEVTANNAQTRKGVGTGDNLRIAERRYSGLQCGGLNAGSDEYGPLPVCTGRVGARHYMSFYEDPIEKMFLTTNPRRLEWP